MSLRLLLGGLQEEGPYKGVLNGYRVFSLLVVLGRLSPDRGKRK